MSKLLVPLLFFVSFSIYAQIDISSLNEMGIKSEHDLKKLGFSSSEISALKHQYFNNENTKVNSDLSKAAKLVPKKQEKIIIPTHLQSTIKKTDSLNLVYGRSLFSDGSVKIQKNSDRIKAPGNYILGTDDVLSIVIWGTSEFSGTFTLDDYGNITPSLVGRISLKGKKYSEAKKIIKSTFGRVYDLRNSKIAIELSYSKVISVNIAGEVKSPGTYSIPSINSAFNFLALAGGITDLGSLRNIKIIHTNGSIEHLDIYKFLTNPAGYNQKYLLDGDFIIVPTNKSIVDIKGANRSLKYELKEGESISDLLSFSGGIANLFDSSKAHVIRGTNSGLKLIDVALSDFSSFQLKGNDVVSFYQLDNSLINSVFIKGAIISEGDYAFVESEKLSNLIERAGGSISNANLKTGHIYRVNKEGKREIIRIDLEELFKKENSTNDINILPNDIVNIFDQRTQNETHKIKITGLVKHPENYDFIEGIELQDIILLSGGLQPQADQQKIDIERINFENTQSEYVTVIEVNYNTDKKFKLKPFDIIHVRKLPEFSYHKMVSIKGEVKYPGNYSISNKSEKLYSLIQRAGGITIEAFLQGGYIMRTQDSIGLIVIKLKDLLKSEKSKYNYVLKEGDKIFIPKESNTVSIIGAIGYAKHNESGANKISCPYTKGKSAKYYIKNYGGGYNKEAKRLKVYILGHNGLVTESKLYGLISPKVKKGDIIKVDTKPQKKQRTNDNKVNWNKTIESLSLKLTGLATFWVLAQRINP